MPFRMISTSLSPNPVNRIIKCQQPITSYILFIFNNAIFSFINSHNQFLKRPLKSHIIFPCSFLRAFQMILPRSPPCFLAQMPLHKHLVYIFICVPFPGLMYRICSLSQSHCSHAIILSYNNVIFPAKIYKCKINGIRPCPDNFHFTVIRIQYMIGVS